jgi:hypothetical protein
MEAMPASAAEAGTEDLGRRIDQLSQEAFRLAKATAANQSDGENRKGRAREIDRQLDELVSKIQALPAAEQPSLVEAWNDGRLDIGFVLSDGKQPMSLRLQAHLRP